MQASFVGAAILIAACSVRAKVLNVTQAAQEAIDSNLHLPAVTIDGRYNTMNEQGAMFPQLNANQRQFLQLAGQENVSLLEIGPAYGHVCLEALKQGAQDYAAIELGEEHLKILARQIPVNQTRFVNLIHGPFPSNEVVADLGAKKFDAILADLVFHFLTSPHEVQVAFNRSFELLKPSGRLYGSVITAYCHFMTQSFRDNFDKQIEAFLRAPSTDGAPGFTPYPR